MKKLTILFAAVVILGSITTVRAGSGIPKNYPLTTCPVSGDKLGEHGKSIKVTAPDGTDVYLCCKDCLKDFKKPPAKYAKMVKDAAPKK
jgi:YHS domain-containing protein